MLDLSGERIFKSAAGIASVSEAFEYFSQEHGFSESEVDFLLKFENPLKFISDKWDVGLRNLPQTLDAIFSEQEWTLQNSGYTLVSDETEPMREPVPDDQSISALARNYFVTGDKTSVMELIRQSQGTRDRTVEQKETTDRKNNTGPDL